MEIGTKFTYLSNGKERKALFLEEENGRIIAILCDDIKFQGMRLSIDKSQIISAFCLLSVNTFLKSSLERIFLPKKPLAPLIIIVFKGLFF